MLIFSKCCSLLSDSLLSNNLAEVSLPAFICHKPPLMFLRQILFIQIERAGKALSEKKNFYSGQYGIE